MFLSDLEEHSHDIVPPQTVIECTYEDTLMLNLEAQRYTNIIK